MEIKNLITFTKVAETQSLSKAAKMLGYAQSTVTMQMQQLEQELGAQLYERVGKQIRITQTGQEFLSYAASIVRMSEEALLVGKSQDSISGSLRLGILKPLADHAFAGQLDLYLTNYPDVNLDVLTNPDPGELRCQLRHNELDLLITLDEFCTEPDLIHAGNDEPVALHLYAGKTHPLEDSLNLSFEQLSFYPLIRTECFPFGEYILDSLSQKPGNQTANISSPWREKPLRVHDPELALSLLVREGSCTGDASGTPPNCAMQNSRRHIALLPDLLVQNHPSADHLVRLDFELPDCRLWKQVLYHKNKWLTPAMKAWLASV